MDSGSRGGPAATALVLAPALGAAVAALFPGRPSAFVAAAAAAAALVLVAARVVRDRRAVRPVPLVAAAALAAAVLFAGWSEIRPLASAPAMLSRGVAALEDEWSALLGRLEAAVADVPPPGSDYGWIGARQERLGPRSGLAVMDGEALEVLAWRGWSTRLDDIERATLLERLGSGSALIVLRRGFAVRLLHARSVRDADGRVVEIVAAERPLAEEPDPGVLARGLAPALLARVRWEAIGEGVRAEFGPEVPGDAGGARDVPLWSLVPLMSRDGRLAGRISLGLASGEARRRAQQERRRTFAALGLAALILALAGAGTLPWWSLVGARAALLLPGDGLSRVSGAHDPSAWLPFPDLASVPRGLEALWHTPLDAAVTGLTLAGLAALAPLPRRGGARAAAVAAGAAAIAVGLWATWTMTASGLVAPGEVLLAPHDDLETRAAAVLALVTIPWAGALVVLRAAWPGRGVAVVVAALGAGLLAGAVHGEALSAAARRVAEVELAARVRARAEIWTAALLDSLEAAVPSRPGGTLTPDRDAIDLWWNSPLGRLGLASGVWKFAAGEPSAPVDAFLTGIPPVILPSRLTVDAADAIGPFPRDEVGPEMMERGFVEGDVELLVSEVQRPNGGAWVAAVLVEPGNLPGRSRDDPLRGLRAGGPSRARLRPAGLEPELAWFDEAGALIATDLDAGPPAPLAPPPEPRWRRADVEGRPVRLFEMPDPLLRGTITAIVAPPDLLARSALSVAWSILLAALALAFSTAGALLSRPVRAARAAAATVRGLVTHFRGQLAVAFVAVALLALLALAGAGRATAQRQTRAQLLGEGARLAHFAKALVEDYEVLVPEGPLRTGSAYEADEVAAWFARTIGEDVFVWRDGLLLATSRPDLVRAGLWPERLPGDLWDAVAGARRPLAVEPFALRGEPVPSVVTVAHGPYRSPVGPGGVVSVPLGSAGVRLERQLADIDRALLVSSFLLVALSLLMLVPATRRLVAPLAQLERATARVAGGEFDTPVPEAGYEETRSLARAFRAMTASLAAQRRSLEQRRRAFETLIETMPVAVVAFAGREVLATNPRARELVGPWLEGNAPAEGPLQRALRELRASRGDEVRTIEVEGDGSAQTGRTLRAAGIDLPELIEGEPARLIVVEDLTDALRAERLTAWAEMARRVAHEIKNPLTPISLMVEHVRRLAGRDDPRLRETLEECLATIADQVAVLRDTSREFSDYARLLVPHPARLDLREEVERWLAPYLTAPPDGVEVALVDGEPLPPVEADPRLLRRAVTNLVENALSAVRGGGRVEVSLAHDAGAGEARIRVEDDGPGIEPTRVGALFEADVTTRDTGSGLGLPIVREAVEAHGGRIEVDPRPGAGARFTIVLPVAAAGRAEPHGADA